MKNIDRYTNTKDALKAWDKYQNDQGRSKRLSFPLWLGDEYVKPNPPTLLEAAETETFYAVEWKNLNNDGKWHSVTDEGDELRRFETAETARDCIAYVSEREKARGFSVVYRLVKMTREVVE